MVIAKDKLQHAIGGAGVAIGSVVVVLAALTAGMWVACTLAGILVGAGYEALQDYRNEGQPDPWDAAFTAAGASLMGAFIEWIGPLLM